ncbi:MAG: MMPL family transporter [Solirubrobacteraceae bacterium MAG38_C4-C5]|nr:MMPL family transporter [Candidatus Siliceabacter maunaloa]
MARAFATAIVRARWAVVIGWIALTVILTFTLPSIQEAQTGGLGDLVPTDSAAIDAEIRSAELFAFPFISRTQVVERDPAGMSGQRVGFLVQRTAQLIDNQLDGLGDAAGAYLYTNHVGDRPFVRERGTTAVMPIIFPPDIGQAGRTARAERVAYDHLQPAPPGAFVGVTGTIPARAAQADVIVDSLPLFELATLAFVFIAVGVYTRSIVAPLVNLIVVAVAYLIAIRLIATVGQAVGVSVPAEVEPIVVALLFGIVTDYVLFYISRFRRRLTDGVGGHEAARDTAAELTPIVLACGLAVAAGTGALAVAELGFLQAFGPGMAMTVLVGLAVALTFVPALLAALGPALLWPSRPGRESRARAASSRSRSERLLRVVVRRPAVTIVLSLVALGAMSSGVVWLQLGNPIIQGLPPDAGPRVAYDQVSEGFAPGVVSPTAIVVEAPGIGAQDLALEQLAGVLADQAGVAAVIGPGLNPTGQTFGVLTSLSGDAARFVVVLDEDPLGSRAIRRLDNLEERLPGLLDAVGIEDATAVIAGDTALASETVEAAVSDIWRVLPAVLGAVALVLIVFLRGLVAPLYLVAVAAISPLAATGLAVYFFTGILGYPELNYFVPIAAGVLLIALGSDYNVFLVGRIWAEARRRPLEEAIVMAGAGASRAISAAGIVLAASFAATALVPIQTFRELAFLVAVGLLIDAFLVRSVLVPAVIALVGYRSGWPGNSLSRVGPRAGRAVGAGGLVTAARARVPAPGASAAPRPG